MWVHWGKQWPYMTSYGDLILSLVRFSCELRQIINNNSGSILVHTIIPSHFYSFTCQAIGVKISKPFSLLILARMSPWGRNLGVKAEFLHSDPRDLVDSPQKSPHESYGWFCQNSRWPPHIVDKSWNRHSSLTITLRMLFLMSKPMFSDPMNRLKPFLIRINPIYPPNIMRKKIIIKDGRAVYN